MRAAVGLGNPGRRYARTRHNLGFRVVERLAADHGGRWSGQALFELSEVVIEQERLLLVKPQTYMNDSGAAVGAAVRDFGIDADDLLVVVDDVNLGSEALRFRRRGSDGGHNGIRSIIRSLECPDFARLRLGVGMPPEGMDLIDYVLGEIEPGELDVVESQLVQAARGVVCWMARGIDAAMNQYNSV